MWSRSTFTTIARPWLSSRCDTEKTGSSFQKGSATALTWAAVLRHEKIVLLLLNNGAYNGEQLLKAAILAGNLQIVRMPLEKSANPNNIDIFRIPNMLPGKLEVKYNFLLEHCFDPADLEQEHDVIRWLLRKGHVAVLQMLVYRGVELCDFTITTLSPITSLRMVLLWTAWVEKQQSSSHSSMDVRYPRQVQMQCSVQFRSITSPLSNSSWAEDIVHLGTVIFHLSWHVPQNEERTKVCTFP